MEDAMGQKTPPCGAFFRMYDEEDAEQRVRPPCLAEPPGPQTRFEKQSAGLCPSFSPALLMSVEEDAPLDLSSVFRIVEEQKTKRTQLEVKKKVKLAAKCSGSSSGWGRDRGVGGSVPDSPAQRQVPAVQEVCFGD